MWGALGMMWGALWMISFGCQQKFLDEFSDAAGAVPWWPWARNLAPARNQEGTRTPVGGSWMQPVGAPVLGLFSSLARGHGVSANRRLRRFQRGSRYGSGSGSESGRIWKELHNVFFFCVLLGVVGNITWVYCIQVYSIFFVDWDMIFEIQIGSRFLDWLIDGSVERLRFKGFLLFWKSQHFAQSWLPGQVLCHQTFWRPGTSWERQVGVKICVEVGGKTFGWILCRASWCISWFMKRESYTNTLPKFNSSPLKNGGWKTR